MARPVTRFKATNNNTGKKIEFEIEVDQDRTIEVAPFILMTMTGLSGSVLREYVVTTEEDANDFLAAVTEAHRDYIERLRKVGK